MPNQTTNTRNLRVRCIYVVNPINKIVMLSLAKHLYVKHTT